MKLHPSQLRSLLKLRATNKAEFLAQLSGRNLTELEFDAVVRRWREADARTFFRGLWPT